MCCLSLSCTDEQLLPPREAYAARWKEYKPARDEQFRIKEDKARRESALNTQFAKKLREEFDAKQ